MSVPSESTMSAQRPGRLLTSRLGRRLLSWFVICAVVPTCAVAALSFLSVSRQLTLQGRQRLVALAGAAGKTLVDRLSFLSADLERQEPALVACVAAVRVPASDGCGDDLLYAVAGLAGGPVHGFRQLAGASEGLDEPTERERAMLAPGQSGILVRREASQLTRRFYLIHRARLDPGIVLLASVSTDYLWSSADDDGLPGHVTLDLLDGASRLVLGNTAGHPVPTDAARQLQSRDANGSFEWAGDRAYLAGWAALAAPAGLRLPDWRVVVSEPRADVIRPVAGFTRSFPVLLAVALVGIVLLSLSQIRRGLIPLAALRQGTLRIAAGDFRTPVQVSGHDELADLGGAFNTMTNRLDHQFRALETAAEIDRAVLSSVDTAVIAHTVLDRVPDLVSCPALSLTVLAGDSSLTGQSWVEQRCGERSRSVLSVQLTPEESAAALEHPEWMVLGGEGGAPLPGYLEPLRNGSDSLVLCCPLYHGGELLGLLALRDESGGRSNESWLELRRLADRIAVALCNARMMERVRVLAFYDALTGLPNRVLYRERLRQALARAAERRDRVAVCSLDLDHFSRVNDTLGQGLGDALLQEVASRLRGCCRPAEADDPAGDEATGVQVVRLGGDEFAVVLPDLDGPADALRWAQRLQESFQPPFRLDNQEVCVTASIGVALYPDDGGDGETVHKHADAAMSHAKSEGRNTIVPFAASMNAQGLARLQLEQEVRRALELGEFVLWYQPIVELANREMSGAEALARWEVPGRGIVGPDEFIPLCEESGLIVPLGEWTLRSVCAQIREWERAGYDPPRVSVNLSARHLRERGVVRMVQDVLDETGVQPGGLVIELTESLLLEPGGTTERRIRELAELGLTLAVDDFGTGYSSLSYLKHYPISLLKIDRSFVEGLPDSPDAAAIATAIVALGGAMDLQVVAEGVETRAQASFLRRRGCHKAQGYLFGRPVSVAQFVQEHLSARRRSQRVSA